LYVSICFFAPFSGGHFNPAVTLAVFLNEHSESKMKKRSLLYYFGGQFLGSTIGCVLSKIVYDCGAGPYGKWSHDLTSLQVFNHSFG